MLTRHPSPARVPRVVGNFASCLTLPREQTLQIFCTDEYRKGAGKVNEEAEVAVRLHPTENAIHTTITRASFPFSDVSFGFDLAPDQKPFAHAQNAFEPVLRSGVSWAPVASSRAPPPRSRTRAAARRTRRSLNGAIAATSLINAGLFATNNTMSTSDVKPAIRGLNIATNLGIGAYALKEVLGK